MTAPLTTLTLEQLLPFAITEELRSRGTPQHFLKQPYPACPTCSTPVQRIESQDRIQDFSVDVTFHPCGCGARATDSSLYDAQGEARRLVDAGDHTSSAT